MSNKDEFEFRENQNQRYEVPPYEGKPVPIRPQSYNTSLASGGPEVPKQGGKVSSVYDVLPINAKGVLYILSAPQVDPFINNVVTYSHEFIIPAGKVFVLRKFRLRGDTLTPASPPTSGISSIEPVVSFRMDGAAIEGLTFTAGIAIVGPGIITPSLTLNGKNFTDTFVIFPENSVLSTFITINTGTPPYTRLRPRTIRLEIYGDLLLSTGINPAYEIGI